MAESISSVGGVSGGHQHTHSSSHTHAGQHGAAAQVAGNAMAAAKGKSGKSSAGNDPMNPTDSTGALESLEEENPTLAQNGAAMQILQSLSSSQLSQVESNPSMLSDIEQGQNPFAQQGGTSTPAV